MVSVLLSRVVIILAGTLYPAYRSFKAVRTKDVREYVKWMMYWIVFALFCCVETVADIFVAIWMPFYYELKILVVLWLLSPWTKGASMLYRKFVHPTLMKHERDIDQLLEQARAEGYNAVVRVGSRGLLAARELLASAAVRGQAQLVQQLRRSQSLNDVSDGGRLRAGGPRVRIEEIREEEDEEEDGGGAPDDRVWRGFYADDGRVVEQEFQYLDDELAADGDAPRRSQRQRQRPASYVEVHDGYATVPRRGGGGGGRRARRQVSSEVFDDN